MTDIRQTILDTVDTINPIDDLEQAHKNDVVAWVKSGEPIFRISKPDNPPKHLVSYFVLYDPRSMQLMLIDHIKAQLWLPTGGHVEIDEDPRTTVTREAYEELKIAAKFDTVFGRDPVFITVTETKGQGTHTDVSLWYVIEGDPRDKLAYDEGEMNGYRWLSLQNVLATDITELDPHMHRFVVKMQRIIAT
jgi:8-oxo-dGTP diphosphatase